MSVRVQHGDFDAGAEIARLRRSDPGIGAVASFIGQVRDVNDGATVGTLTLEHYPGMTEKTLAEIIERARTRWDFFDALIIHRIGKLEPLDQIVMVAVAGSHRDECFSACEFIMDYLKTEAPFWKKEQTPEGERWVDARVSDDVARQRWEQ
ncbi:MAG TPA: molybdopterin synthase catalytic subunit MoaE [Novimethylophilus sp.]|jgi:molybdopterin synthase catalytic subunit|uniref:molybdopterin synthase catalytic subunit MoaE n=1 Tax=Novimethylophilus sp. TaxID=2137426 RepID=UPI002F4150C3